MERQGSVGRSCSLAVLKGEACQLLWGKRHDSVDPTPIVERAALISKLSCVQDRTLLA